jgi:glutathione synthetase
LTQRHSCRPEHLNRLDRARLIVALLALNRRTQDDSKSQNFSDRNVRIAFYTTPDVLANATSDTRYIHEELVGRFDVSVHSSPDPGLCRDADVVFCRFRLPLRSDFLRALAPFEQEKLIVNRPSGQLALHSKRHLLRFPALTPPTIVTCDPVRIRSFAREHGTVVLKPLFGHHGVGVVRLHTPTASDGAFDCWMSDYVREHGTPLVQRYVQEIHTLGCKRINIVAGRPVSARVATPADGTFICHDHHGAVWSPTELDDRDHAVMDAVLPVLRSHGIWLAGIDTLGPYLGEVNVATPNTLQKTDSLHGYRRGIEAVLEGLEAHRQGIRA